MASRAADRLASSRPASNDPEDSFANVRVRFASPLFVSRDGEISLASRIFYSNE